MEAPSQPNIIEKPDESNNYVFTVNISTIRNAIAALVISGISVFGGYQLRDHTMTDDEIIDRAVEIELNKRIAYATEVIETLCLDNVEDQSKVIDITSMGFKLVGMKNSNEGLFIRTSDETVVAVYFSENISCGLIPDHTEPREEKTSFRKPDLIEL